MATNIIDFAAAKRLRDARRSRPFQGKLLKVYAASIDPRARAVMVLAVADGFAAGRTTSSILASIRRDAVRQAARAAL